MCIPGKTRISGKPFTLTVSLTVSTRPVHHDFAWVKVGSDTLEYYRLCGIWSGWIQSTYQGTAFPEGQQCRMEVDLLRILWFNKIVDATEGRRLGFGSVRTDRFNLG